ncbi:hypothetical protein FBU30_006306 [Linnemannia zychae]|nr:hypothetical protein FBU30_006306 [Linnemannia zychae]
MSTIIATTTAPATVNNTMANELTQSQSRLLLPSTATASPANSSLTVDLLNARVTNQNKALGLLTEQVFAMAVRLDETVKQSQIQHDKTIQQFTQQINDMAYQHKIQLENMARQYKDQLDDLDRCDISGEDLGGEEYEGDKGSDGEYKDPTDEGYREQSGEQSEVSNDDEYYKVMRRTAGKKANRERNHSDKGVVEIPVRTTRTEIFSEPIFNTLLDEVAELYFQLSQEETIRLEPDYRFSTPIRSLEDVWQRWIVSEKNRPSVWCLGAYSETWRKRFGLTEQSAYYIQRRLVYNVFRHLLRLDKGSLVERVARAKAKVQAEIEIAGSLYKYSRPPAKKKGDTNGKSTQNGYPTVARLKRLRSKSEN